MYGNGVLLQAILGESLTKIFVLYPPSLKKTILGDYGHPNTAAIQWGQKHENDALKAYEDKLNVEVDVCGIFLSTHFPFLGATPVAWSLNKYFCPINDSNRIGKKTIRRGIRSNCCLGPLY